MKQHCFLKAIGAFAIALGTAGTQVGIASATLFTPPTENSAPRSATGGASRGSFFVPPTDNTAPQGSTGGASRGLFDGPETAVAANSGNDRSNIYGEMILPTGSSAAASMLAVLPESFYGTTLEARPTILVYVPASNADTAVFSLKNEAKETVYNMAISIPEAGGVVAIEMPAEAPELKVSEYYQWYVAVQLDGELTPASPYVDGWIKRIEPSADMDVALDEGDALAKIAALGANGVWYDTAAQLASLQGVPANETMASHWYELLESVGLADIAAAPIVM
ncbi:MAG: DUF928 domain-containing protein [Cyanobacteria bacterium J06633_23]